MDTMFHIFYNMLMIEVQYLTTPRNLNYSKTDFFDY